MSLRQAAIFARRVMGNARDYLWFEKYEQPTVEWNSGQQAAELQEALRQLHEALDEPDPNQDLINALLIISNKFNENWDPLCIEREMGDIARAALAKVKANK